MTDEADTRTLEQLLADCRERFGVNAFEQGIAAMRPPFDADGVRAGVGDPKPQHAADQQRAPVEEKRDNPTIPPTFRWASIEASELRMRVGRPRAIVEAVEAIRASGVLFTGPSGSGKTSLACALFRAWEARHTSRRAVFAAAWRLGVARSHHGLGQGEPPEVEKAIGADLLLLDDLGSERNTMMNAVGDVLFERAYLGRTSWVTTWMTPEQVAQRYGGGLARRLYEEGRAVVINCTPPPKSPERPRAGSDS